LGVRKAKRLWRDESSIISFLRGMARTVGRPSVMTSSGWLEVGLDLGCTEWKPTIEVGWKDEEILFKRGENLRFQ